jgi:hypothetical protein
MFSGKQIGVATGRRGDRFLEMCIKDAKLAGFVVVRHGDHATIHQPA